ncbi:hypothetical protein AKJ09_02520 [Labilithrix luteola]|uniref:Uncharacterized protein n=1 Tax=Labilithrix luteola TaxID=1391654 RepID=A0A0K1PR52_9BACT|nr:hypothetical protein [Labilithrix luteola]AKU95856.1 hypothetical protein AKJ09_02520 [Labilithrix luteola]
MRFLGGSLLVLGPLVSGSLVLGVLAVGCAEGATDATDGEDFDAGRAVDAATSAKPVEAGPGEPDAKADASKNDKDASSNPDSPCAKALAAIMFDFESGAQGWTHGISDGVAPPPAWPYDPWALGIASAGTKCASGVCFGTELTKNYAQCQRGFLASPSIDLSACTGQSVSLVFEHAYAFADINATTRDGGVVEVSGDDGASWQLAKGTYPGMVAINPSRPGGYQCTQPSSFGVNGKQGFVGSQPSTTKVSLELPSTAVSAKTRVRFSFASGVTSSTVDPDASRAATDFGWRIDNVGFATK